MSRSLIYVAILMSIVIGSCVSTSNEKLSDNGMPTQVFTLEKATVIEDTFGIVKLFTKGNVATYGTKDVTTGTLSILPNHEAHPPHKHVEEEYLFVTKGSGTWSINGKEFEAKAGDLLYASPWDLHGIFNSDTVDLEFYFVKWNNKGIPLPVE